EGGLDDAFNLPRVPRGTITLDNAYVAADEKALPRCVIIDAEDMLFKGTGFDRKRVGNLQCDPACLFSWMRYLLKHNFMVVAVCSPAYLTPMQVLYPHLLKMLAQYGLMDFPLELLDPRNTYRILETAKRVGGVIISTNKFEEHHDDPEILELAQTIVVAPDYLNSMIKDTEWFYKSRDGQHWLAYHCPQFKEKQFPKPPFIRGRLFASPSHLNYEITCRYRKSFTELRRDKLIAIVDYAIMERMKTPCAFIKPQSLKSSRLRIQLMKELEMQLSVKRWRTLLKDVKLRRARERAENEAKREWVKRLKNRSDAAEKREIYRETEIERLREQYRSRAARQRIEKEQEVFDLVEEVHSQVRKKLQKELESRPPLPEVDYDAVWKAELDVWANWERPHRWAPVEPSTSVVYKYPPVYRNPLEYLDLFFKWYVWRLRRYFREKPLPTPEELSIYRVTQDLPPDREIWPYDRIDYIEHEEFFYGRRFRRGDLNWTRKEVDQGLFDDLRFGPFMSKKKYIAF
ncbi:hypothetical protein PMAYCL1PPCAC_32390, partial [Pristionchus mayeri]